MLSSIPSKLTSAKALSSPFALSQTRKAAAKAIPVFGDELTAASATRTGKITARQNSASAKLLAATAAPAAKAKAQAFAAKSLTNKTLPTNNSATAKETTQLARSKSVVAKAEGDTVTTPPPVDPAEAVRAVLTALGYDTSKFTFEAHEEYVAYPGGGYTHKFTSVLLPNGLKENFTTDLMARFPTVTANELKRLMENQHQTASVSVQSFNGGA